MHPRTDTRLSAARFGSAADAIRNARLCYGSEACEGHEFLVNEDAHGWGWGALMPVPALTRRGQGRTAQGTPDLPSRGWTVRHRARPQSGSALQPVAPIPA